MAVAQVQAAPVAETGARVRLPELYMAKWRIMVEMEAMVMGMKAAAAVAAQAQPEMEETERI